MSEKLTLVVIASALAVVIAFTACAKDTTPELSPVTTSGGGAASSVSSATGTDGMPYVCNIDMAMSTCQGPLCHGAPGTAPTATLGGGLDLFAADRVQNMLDMPASYVGVQDMSTCPQTPELIINSTKPASSLMIQKLINGQKCGDKMPSGLVIEPLDKQCIIDWVLSVAAMGTSTVGTSTATATTSMGGAGGSTASTGTESTTGMGGSAGSTSTMSTTGTQSTTSMGGSTASTSTANTTSMTTTMGAGGMMGAGGTMMGAGGSAPF